MKAPGAYLDRGVAERYSIVKWLKDLGHEVAELSKL